MTRGVSSNVVVYDSDRLSRIEDTIAQDRSDMNSKFDKMFAMITNLSDKMSTISPRDPSSL
jgi:hypothetical protein